MTVFSELTLLAIGVDNWTPRGAMDEEFSGVLVWCNQISLERASDPQAEMLCVDPCGRD
jgi:hypothetical protein